MNALTAGRVILRVGLAAAFLTGALAPRAAPAEPVAGGSAVRTDDRELRAYLTLVVNAVRGGDVLVIIRPSDVLVHAAELEAIGVDPPAGARVSDHGEQFVSLAALGAGVTHVVDTTALTLTVTVPPALFKKQTLGVDALGQNIKVSPPLSGGFMNYALTAGRRSPLAFSGELGIALGRGSIQSYIVAAPSGHGYRFEQSAYTVEDFARARRTVFGDTFVDLGDFGGVGGTIEMVGISLHRDLSFNPNLIRRSADGFSGVASSPSTADIYVNGALVRREQIAPGAFTVTDIPLQNGANQTTVVLQDAFGRTQTLAHGGYSSADLLPRGQRQYDAGIGRTPFQPGSTGMTAAGRYDLGLTDRLTAGLRATAGGDLLNFTGVLAAGTPLAEISALASVSEGRAIAPTGIVGSAPAGRLAGSAVALNLTRTTNTFTGGATFVERSANFASAGLTPLADRARTDLRMFARWMPAHSSVSIGLDAQHQVFRDAPSVRELTVGVSKGFGNVVFGSVNVGERGVGALTRPVIEARVDFVLNGVRLSYGVSKSDGTTTSSADISKDSSGSRRGTNFDISDSGGQKLVRWERRGRLADLSLSASSEGALDASLAGGLAFSGGRFYLSPVIQDGFAVVELTGLPGVGIIANGQPIGRTDRKGRIFVPNLTSDQPNTIAVDVEDLPGDALIDTMSQTTVPTYRGGTFVRFEPRRIRAYTGKIRFSDDAASAPTFGQLDIAAPGGALSSAVGTDGQFYLEKIPLGAYDAVVRYAKGSCTLRLVIPDSPKTVTDLGTLLCQRSPDEKP